MTWIYLDIMLTIACFRSTGASEVLVHEGWCKYKVIYLVLYEITSSQAKVHISCYIDMT